MLNNAKETGLAIAAILFVLFGLCPAVSGAEPAVPGDEPAVAEGESDNVETNAHINVPCEEGTHNIVVAPAKSTLTIDIETWDLYSCMCWTSAEEALAYVQAETDYVMANGRWRTTWYGGLAASGVVDINNIPVQLGPPGGDPVEVSRFCYRKEQIENYFLTLLRTPGESSSE